jgi:hypothetical protein
MKLTKRNYYTRKANLEYMSVSQFKAFDRCPASAMAELKGKYKRETTTALLIGSYIDSYFEGTMAKFMKDNPDIFKKDKTLKADFIQANAIIERIERDKLFMSYLDGKKQVIVEGKISGVPVKIKMDALHPDKIVDLKIMKDFANIYTSERGSIPWFDAWGYDLQGAVYQEIYRQNTGKTLPFYIAAATKEKVTDLDIIHFSQEMLDHALDRFKRDVETFDAIKKGIIEPERCGTCDYCKETKVLTEPNEAEYYYF